MVSTYIAKKLNEVEYVSALELLNRIESGLADQALQANKESQIQADITRCGNPPIEYKDSSRPIMLEFVTDIKGYKRRLKRAAEGNCRNVYKYDFVICTTNAPCETKSEKIKKCINDWYLRANAIPDTISFNDIGKKYMKHSGLQYLLCLKDKNLTISRISKAVKAAN